MHVVHISDMANAYNEANFEAEVINSDKPVLVDFWAEWCGPCKMISPLIDQLAEAVGDTANVGKVEVDTNQSLAAKYGVRSIPCLLFFKDGEVKDTITGANVTLDQLKSKLEELA
jgi:thioredoxin 1